MSVEPLVLSSAVTVNVAVPISQDWLGVAADGAVADDAIGSAEKEAGGVGVVIAAVIEVAVAVEIDLSAVGVRAGGSEFVGEGRGKACSRRCSSR